MQKLTGSPFGTFIFMFPVLLKLVSLPVFLQVQIAGGSYQPPVKSIQMRPAWPLSQLVRKREDHPLIPAYGTALKGIATAAC